jgi:hypothetical protein
MNHSNVMRKVMPSGAGLGANVDPAEAGRQAPSLVVAGVRRAALRAGRACLGRSLAVTARKTRTRPIKLARSHHPTLDCTVLD